MSTKTIDDLEEKIPHIINFFIKEVLTDYYMLLLIGIQRQIEQGIFVLKEHMYYPEKYDI